VKFVAPAILSVPLLAAPVFGATAKATAPLPLPVAPDEIVTKVALLVAVHAHPAAAVTGTDPVPPVAANADVVMVPAVTVHDGAVVVLVAVDVLFLQPAQVMTSNRTVAAKKRRSKYAMKTSSKKKRGRHANPRDPCRSSGCEGILMSSFVLSVVRSTHPLKLCGRHADNN
jgi:hypothetical protein